MGRYHASYYTWNTGILTLTVLHTIIQLTNDFKFHEHNDEIAFIVESVPEVKKTRECATYNHTHTYNERN